MSEGDQAANGAGKGAAAKREYSIYLDGGERGLPAVAQWEADHAETGVFVATWNDDGIVVREQGFRTFAPDDLLHLATVEATNRDEATRVLLKGTDPAVQNERCQVVRAAHEAHVSLDFIAVAVNALGVVEAHWAFTPTLSLGAR